MGRNRRGAAAAAGAQLSKGDTEDGFTARTAEMAIAAGGRVSAVEVLSQDARGGGFPERSATLPADPATSSCRASW